MPLKLSPRTRQLVEKIFQPNDVPEAVLWLEVECGNNLPFCEKDDEFSMERIRFAVIKLSGGDILKLLTAIDEARVDWRDLFMSADFGYDVEAHDQWAKEVLAK